MRELSINSIREWLGHGRRRWYAIGVSAVIVLAALATVFPSGGGVSIERMQELLNASYDTSGTKCVAAAHGRDTCKLTAGECSGTLIVAPVGGSNFTIVNATPEQLDSSSCDRGEGIEGEAEGG